MRSNIPIEVELRVVGHRSDVDERGSPFTFFQIRIVADGLSWVVERRFSEFKKLDALVRQRAIEHLGGGNKDPSALPPTIPSAILSSGFFTSSVNAEFVKRRVAGLQARDATPPCARARAPRPSSDLVARRHTLIHIPLPSTPSQDHLQALTRHAAADKRLLLEFFAADGSARHEEHVQPSAAAGRAAAAGGADAASAATPVVAPRAPSKPKPWMAELPAVEAAWSKWPSW